MEMQGRHIYDRIGIHSSHPGNSHKLSHVNNYGDWIVVNVMLIPKYAAEIVNSWPS